MAIRDLEQAMRAAARRKMEDGAEPRDPIAAGRRFEQLRRAPRLLVIVAIVAAALVAAVLGSYLVQAVFYVARIPPAHLLLILAVGLWLAYRASKRR